MKDFAKVKFELNEKGQLKQNVRNGFKAEVMAEVMKMFQDAGMEVYAVADGMAVNFANDELGALAVVFDGVVKGLEYDAEYEAEAYNAVLAEKAEKAVKAEAEKARKIAEKEALKALKEKKAK